MKRAFLIHGWEGYPEESWLPWIKEKLLEKGFDVIVPAMPDTANPTYQKWVPYLTEIVSNPSANDYFVGHSLGCITILRYIETLEDNQNVGGVVLVAGFGHDLDYKGYKGELSSFFKDPINWEKIKRHCPKFVAIHSDDDPWVPLEHNQLFQEKVGAKAIIEHKMKHFSGEDDVTQLPSALKSLLEISNNH